MEHINSFRELDSAVNRLPIWKQIAWAFGWISIPYLEEADRRLSNEYYDALENLDDGY